MTIETKPSKIATKIIVATIGIIVLVYVYFHFTSNMDWARYAIYVADTPVGTTPNTYVTYDSLTRAEKDVFLAAYTAEPGLFSSETIVRQVHWNGRKLSPYRRFLSVEYVKYRSQYYPVTAVLSRHKPVFMNTAEAVLLWMMVIPALILFVNVIKMCVVLSRNNQKRE